MTLNHASAVGKITYVLSALSAITKVIGSAFVPRRFARHNPRSLPLNLIALDSMFIGHFGAALGAKRLAPRTSLATLIFAAQFLDLLWPIFLLAGFEHVRIFPGITRVQPLDFYDYPYSHSLSMALLWAFVVAVLYFLVRRYFRGAWVLALLVLSHWFLDLLMHRPDLPLRPGGSRYGLGLWNSWPASLSAEVLVFGAGLCLYASANRARDGVGKYAFWGLMVFLLVGWLAATFGPPPPDVHTLAISAMTMWLLVPWAWWADSHRGEREP
jgi:hypothetical protein